MVDVQGKLPLGNLLQPEWPPHPNLLGVPHRADAGIGCALGAKTTQTGFPAAVVKAGLLPPVRGFGGGESPRFRFGHGRGQQVREFGQRLVQPFVPLPGLGRQFQNRPVIGHQAIDLHFHIRGLGVDGGSQPAAHQRAQPVIQVLVGIG